MGQILQQPVQHPRAPSQLIPGADYIILYFILYAECRLSGADPSNAITLEPTLERAAILGRWGLISCPPSFFIDIAMC